MSLLVVTDAVATGGTSCGPAAIAELLVAVSYTHLTLPTKRIV